jgi:hypothetical protein
VAVPDCSDFKRIAAAAAAHYALEVLQLAGWTSVLGIDAE